MTCKVSFIAAFFSAHLVGCAETVSFYINSRSEMHTKHHNYIQFDALV